MALNLVPTRTSGRWKPGQSGNPKGEQRDRTLQELCRARTEEAVKTLIVMMRTKSANQLPATLALLDRGWGKPVQRLESEGDAPIHLHLVAAQLVEAQHLEAREPAEPQHQPMTIDGSIPTE